MSCFYFICRAVFWKVVALFLCAEKMMLFQFSIFDCEGVKQRKFHGEYSWRFPQKEPSWSVYRSGGVPQGTTRGPLIVWCKCGNEGLKGTFLLFAFVWFFWVKVECMFVTAGTRGWCSNRGGFFILFFSTPCNLDKRLYSVKVYLSVFWIWCNTFDKNVPFFVIQSFN